MKTTSLAIAIAALGALYGCGGGGGGSSAPAPASPPAASTDPANNNVGNSGVLPSSASSSAIASNLVVPIEPAMAKLYQQGKFFAKQDNVLNGATYAATVTYAFQGDTAFESVPTSTEQITREVSKNNAAATTTTQTDFFSLAPFTMKGRYTPDAPAAKYFIADPSSQVRLPATGKPGDFGDFYNANVYSSRDGNKVLVGTSTQKWVMRADTEKTALFCINTVITNTGITQKSTTVECFRIDTNGDVQSTFFTISG